MPHEAAGAQGGAQSLTEAAVGGGGAGGNGGLVYHAMLDLVKAGSASRLDAIMAGGPHRWGLLALVGWVLWLLMQAPWHGLLRRRGAPPPAWGWRRDPPGLVLRFFWFGTTAALLWICHLDPQEFQSWEDVYFFCGQRYQHCTAAFRWSGSGWLQAIVLWNFVLSVALLAQKWVVALGLGGLLPGEEVVTRESFISIAWRLVPYWMNQWEQQWGAECSSMLFELPHFALELLVVLPCVQIFCGRLRVMAQPHIRDPAPPPAPAHDAAAAEAAPDGAAAREAAAGLAGDAADAPAADVPAAAAAAAAAGRGGDWVPDVMRCRWRRDPSQRRLMPRLKSHARAMALAALVLTIAGLNSLVVPLLLESQPAASQRANQILRLQKELSFLVATGRHADTALWYQRLAAAAAQAEQAEEEAERAGGHGGNASSSAGDASAAEAAAAGMPEAAWLSPAAAPPAAGGEGAAGFLAAALEGSSNSSRLDAKLAVWSTLWQPLLPQHWLRAVLAADASQVAGLRPHYLAALQFAEHSESAELAAQLHAAANDARATARAQAALQQLLAHPEQAGSILPPSDRSGRGDRDATVQLLLMAALAGGVDARTAPLRLRPADSADPAAAADLSWLRAQQRMYAAKAGLPSGSRAAGGLGAAKASANASANAPHASWQQQQRMAPLYRLLAKHCTELERMRSADHKRLIPLVEVSLAIMRLSCERFFSLLAAYLAFLLFRDPPPAARAAVRVVATCASVFQRLVLYSFPAICWAYGAGALFSSFVSVVFWTGPVVRAVERLRGAAVSVQPRLWRAATSAEVERMGGSCAICWGDMPVPAPATPAAVEAAGEPRAAPGGGGAAAADEGGAPAGPGARGMALPCSHAFHSDCLQQWLQQCYGQARSATCPMCQASIPLRVRYRLPWHGARGAGRQAGGGAGEPGGEAGGPLGGGDEDGEGIPGLQALVRALQDDFRARFEARLDAEPEHPQALEWPPAAAILMPPEQPVAQQPLPPPPQQQQRAVQQPEEPPPPQQQQLDAGATAPARPAPQAATGDAAADPPANQQGAAELPPLPAAQGPPPQFMPQAPQVEQQRERRRGFFGRLLRRRRGGA